MADGGKKGKKSSPNKTGRYKQYRESNKQWLHKLVRMLKSNGLAFTQKYCQTRELSTNLLNRAIRGRKPHGDGQFID